MRAFLSALVAFSVCVTVVPLPPKRGETGVQYVPVKDMRKAK